MKTLLTTILFFASFLVNAETVKDIILSSINDTTGTVYQVKAYSEPVTGNGYVFKMKIVNIDREFLFNITPEEFETYRNRSSIRVNEDQMIKRLETSEKSDKKIATILLCIVGFFLLLIVIGLIASPSFRENFFEGIIWLG